MSNKNQTQPAQPVQPVQPVQPPQPTPSGQIPNLWPDVISKVQIRAPVAILKEQAGLLGAKTQNIVSAYVSPGTKTDGGHLVFWFSLVAPALGNYTLRLFTITHRLTALYPILITSGFVSDKPDETMQWSVANESELLTTLKSIFSNKKTVEAIQAMLAQSEGVEVEPVDDVPF